MKLVNLLVAGLILCVAGAVIAQDAPSTRPARGIGGQITKIDGATLTIKTMARGGAEGKEVTVTTDDKTTVTIDKKDAKVADLKVDMYVRVTPATGTATKITASTTKPERRGPAKGN